MCVCNVVGVDTYRRTTGTYARYNPNKNAVKIKTSFSPNEENGRHKVVTYPFVETIKTVSI